MKLTLLGYDLAIAEAQVEDYRQAYKEGRLPLSALSNFLTAINPLMAKWRRMQLVIETLGGSRLLYEIDGQFYLRQTLDSRRVYWYHLVDCKPIVITDAKGLEEAFQHERKRHKK